MTPQTIATQTKTANKQHKPDNDKTNKPEQQNKNTRKRKQTHTQT